VALADLTQTILSLKLGATTPADAPLEVAQALRNVEVVQGSRCPSGFRLTFQLDRYPPVPGTPLDYSLISGGLLDPFVRVQVLVQAGDDPATVLIDGFITRQELSVDESENSLLTVIGEDVSVKMDLFEVSAEFPTLTDSAIVSQILGNYSSLGITPQVTAPTGEAAPQSWVPQQNSTDRYYLQMLAARYGFLFYIQPGSSAGQNTAYWGPPLTSGTPQPALTTNMWKANNIKSLSISYDALAPTMTYGQALDLSQVPAVATPIAISSASQTQGFSTITAIDSQFSSLAQSPSTFTSQLAKLSVRGTLLTHQGLTPTDAQSLGQGKTDRSVQEVVVVEGEVDTAEYGAIMTAPGLIDLRGVGQRFDGRYYMKQVTHNLSLDQGEWRYLQKFVLTRAGAGSTITQVASVSGTE
jgi:hypothetical protein